MQLEEIAEDYQTAVERKKSAPCSRLELYSLSATQYYSGSIGGGNIFSSGGVWGHEPIEKEEINFKKPFWKGSQFGKSAPLPIKASKPLIPKGNSAPLPSYMPMGLPAGYGLGSSKSSESIFDKLMREADESLARLISKSIELGKKTGYFKLGEDSQYSSGVTHHSTGIGKLKLYDKENEIEYSVPLIDILNKRLKDWRIEKK